MRARDYLDDTNEQGVPVVAALGVLFVAFIARLSDVIPPGDNWLMAVAGLTALGVYLALGWYLRDRKRAWLKGQPVGAVAGVVRAKRSEQWTGFKRGVIRTTHSVTFEVEAGRRVEFAVVDHEVFGAIAEGDVGVVEYRGPFLIDFRRAD